MSTAAAVPEASPVQGGNVPEAPQAPAAVAPQVQPQPAGEESIGRMMSEERAALIASIFGEDVDRAAIPAEQRANVEKRAGAVFAPPEAQPEAAKAPEVPKADAPVIPEVPAPQQTTESLVGEGKRFKSQGDLETSYRNLEGEYTRRTQEWSRVMKQAGVNSQEELDQAVQHHLWVQNVYKPWLAQQNGQGQPADGQQMPTQPPAAQQPGAQSVRLLDMDKDALLEKFTEDPHGTFRGMFREAMLDQGFVEQTVPELAATRLRDKLFDEFNVLSDKYPDVEQVAPVMTALYQDVPGMRGRPMEEVYWLAKGRMYDELRNKSKQVVTQVAQQATEAAYQNQDVKRKAAVDGAVSTEPGLTQTKDEWDKLMESIEANKVKI